MMQNCKNDVTCRIYCIYLKSTSGIGARKKKILFLYVWGKDHT